MTPQSHPHVDLCGHDSMTLMPWIPVVIIHGIQPALWGWMAGCATLDGWVSQPLADPEMTLVPQWSISCLLSSSFPAVHSGESLLPETVVVSGST